MSQPSRDGQASLDLSIESPDDAAAAIEALLFASGSAEDVPTLAAALGWSQTDVKRGLDALGAQLRDGRRGVMLQRDGETVQLVSAPRFGQPIARLLGMERTTKLSSAALETLALVAYRQPVTRSEIEAIRGVDSSGVLATLVARELVEPRGRRSTPGNPVDYGTTAGFLQFFGLTSLDELPPLSD
ncbi:MAG: SMC-Scp complex subunit ScpB [Chloroflexota bacterium]|nr:SMC-Scp complex subunit ScpB [Chloroflexota bacterium]